MIVDLDTAARLLAGGGVIAVPTDTVYGLACVPRAAAAIERIYAIKRRPPTMPLGLLGAGSAQLGEFGAMGAVALRLGAAFWPGALSLIVPIRAGSGLVVTGGGSTVSVRVPDHHLLRTLLASTGVLATTSANRHGEPAAVSAEACEAELGAVVDGVLDGGPAGGTGSTIIDLTTAVPRLLRTGPISADALRPHLGGAPLQPSPPPAGA